MPPSTSCWRTRGRSSISRRLDGVARPFDDILKEAELQHDGQRLGDVGGRIVAEVLLGLLAGDPHSYRSERPGFTPHKALAPKGKFGMPELIGFAFG